MVTSVGVSSKNEFRVIRRGQIWTKNMNLTNDYYYKSISSDKNTNPLISRLKKDGHKLEFFEIKSFCTVTGSAMITDIYVEVSQYDNKPHVCFSTDPKGVTKLLCTASKNAQELQLSNQMPAIFIRDNNKVIGINTI